MSKLPKQLNECTLQEIEDAIMDLFVERQCEIDDPENGMYTNLLDEEISPSVTYYHIEKELGIEKELAKPFLIRLRNGGNIQLGMTVNSDYMPSGSGYFLTKDRAEYSMKCYNLRHGKKTV